MNAKYAICGSRRSDIGLVEGLEILKNGGSAIDAVELAINAIEDNPNDPTVGFNGFPNLLGEIELDASIMDGKTMRAGAVAGLKKIRHPISVARKVMELSPHVLLVGEGAQRFAKAIGFKEEELWDERSKNNYKAIMEGKKLILPPDASKEFVELYKYYDEKLPELIEKRNLKEWYSILSFEKHGTTNVIALDHNKNLVVGVSTSGLALKFPGRAGDSPVIGAGNYCNSLAGAACTGTGELAIRLSLARMVVFFHENGNTIKKAAIKAIKQLKLLNEDGTIHILAMDHNGDAIGVSNKEGLHYFYANDQMEEIEKRESVFVEI